MNWTGGDLRKGKKGGRKATVASKQKQHFANARALLPNTDFLSSFKPSFLEEDKSTKLVSTQRAREPIRKARQSMLEEYRSLSHVAERLSSMTARRREDHSRPRPSHEINITSSNRGALTSQRRVNSPSSHSTKSKLGRVVARAQLPGNSAIDLQGSDYHELKRNELLRRQDWVGLNRSNPFHLDVVSDRGKPRIAKRRMLNSDDDFRRRMTEHGRTRVPSIQNNYKMTGALRRHERILKDENIRIKIGDAALASQTIVLSDVPTSKAATSSSNDMLLDNVDIIGQTTYQGIQARQPSASPVACDTVDDATRRPSCTKKIGTGDGYSKTSSSSSSTTQLSEEEHQISPIAVSEKPAQQQVSHQSTTQVTPLPDSLRQETVQALSENQVQDADAAWKAFVFGVGNDEHDSDSAIAVASEAEEEDSSLIVHVSSKPCERSPRTAANRSKYQLGTPRLDHTASTNQNSENSSENFSFDRPSSIANASTTAAVLYDRRISEVIPGRSKFVFQRPKPFVNPMRRTTHRHVVDNIEDVE